MSLDQSAKPATTTTKQQLAGFKKTLAIKNKNATCKVPRTLAAANARHRAEAGAPNNGVPQRDGDRPCGVSGPPPQLFTKREVLAIVNVSYPTLWVMMREKRFPPSRIVGGRSMWRSDEIMRWLDELPLRQLKPADADKTGGTV